jgi:cytochrome c1
MDQARFEQLKKKRSEEGLTDEEANELGQMFAEAEGAEYQSADQYQAEAMAEKAEAGEGAELAGEAPPDHGPGTEDRPETVKEEAESRPTPDQDAPAGARAPLGGRAEDVDDEH